MASTKSLGLRLDEFPTNPYPALLFDVGVYFRDRTLMKRLDDADVDSLPLHTPLVNQLACRLWRGPDRASELYAVYVKPDSAAMAKLVASLRGENQDSLTSKIAHAAGIGEAEFVETAVSTAKAMEQLRAMVAAASTISSHNLQSDLSFVLAEHVRLGTQEYQDFAGFVRSKSLFCTMKAGMRYCRTLLPGRRPRWPKLWELERDLLGRYVEKSPYDTVADLEGLEDCYHDLVRRSVPAQCH